MMVAVREERLRALEEAVDGLYAVFGRYGPRGNVSGCDHCVSAEDVARLDERPLRQAEWKELEKFAWKAMTTWGSVEDFKYFLPRLFELLPGAPSGSNKEIVVGKLRYGEWTTWPAGEQAAIQRWLMAVWRERRIAEPERAFDWLCAIGQAEDDMSPYLSEWTMDAQGEDGAGIVQLLINDGNQILRKKTLPNAFWQERETQMRQVLEWLGSDVVKTGLERAFFSSEEAAAGRLSLAVQVQEAIAQMRGSWGAK